jgi:hypothetical protein
MVAGYELEDRGSVPPKGSVQTGLLMGREGFSSQLKRPEREADYLVSCSAEVKNTRAILPRRNIDIATITEE